MIVSFSKTKLKIQLSPKLTKNLIRNNIQKLSGADNYVFPILNKTVHITPTQIQNRLPRVIKQVNGNMKVIGKELEIETPITTYVALHTYATVLQRSGVSTSIINNALGHQSESITQTYLDNFEANKNLL